MKKRYNSKSVYDAAIERIEATFNEFENVYVSFSGGKDSGVMLNLVIEVARKMNRLPVNVLVVDLEAQYEHTIRFVTDTMNRPEVKGYWVCLPIHLRNAVSQVQPHWICWDEDKRDAWVRDFPDHKSVISDSSFFPWFRKGMEFEEFVPKFGDWMANGKPVSCMVGIRSDESLNRFRTIASKSKTTWNGYAWTTQLSVHCYNAYPIYDWRTEDIWAANGKFGWAYNKIYDLMHMAGVGLHQQRLCQPYGDDQRKGLYLFKILEPATWQKVVNRVEGANFGNRYSDTDKTVMGNFRVNLPPGHTYKSYAKFLLQTMPPYLADHYQKKIDKFWEYWKKEGFETMPDTADAKLEASRKAPSWRRICKVLLKNDYWCKGLSFSQTKREMEKQVELITKYSEML
jgi:predicted phosphoadenosine phosphosulfate sulfurtransferase